MAKSMSSLPPEEVLVEFLRLVEQTITEHDNLVLVLRGSLLLRHWFGAAARPAADIDLECFARVPAVVAAGGRFESLVEYGRQMCQWAAELTLAYPSQGVSSDIEFRETAVPADGGSLWEYGTPGERFYTGWTWRSAGLTGRLQIDIAEATYELTDIGSADIELTAPGNQQFRYPAYTPEMMLAAKLSWLLRSISWRWRSDGTHQFEWNGEPKDLFDAHLLLTKADLRAGLFEKCLLAVAAEDRFDWHRLETLLDPPATMTDASFANWEAFHRQYGELVPCGPTEMLCAIAEKLEQVLGGFRAHIPFLLSCQPDPVHEAAYLIYADWLEERGDSRGSFLRQFARLYFGLNRLSGPERRAVRQQWLTALQTIPGPWLYQIFGGVQRFREIRGRIEAG